MVLHGFRAGITDLEQVTGIVILPQRQTVLVAKQAAEVDLLTGGRFRLGVGLGWNAVEYQALGKDFTDRGRRIGEQVELLRRLWTEPSVTHQATHVADSTLGAGVANADARTAARASGRRAVFPGGPPGSRAGGPRFAAMGGG